MKTRFETKHLGAVARAFARTAKRFARPLDWEGWTGRVRELAKELDDLITYDEAAFGYSRTVLRDLATAADLALRSRPGSAEPPLSQDELSVLEEIEEAGRLWNTTKGD